MIWIAYFLTILLALLPPPILGDQEAVLVQSHQLSPAFWSDGVDNSKRILEKILRKIRSYEEDISKTLNIHKDLAIKLTNKLMKDEKGQMWVDEGRNVKLVLDQDSQCYEIQNLENLIPNIGYTCEEVDQLHGIGYHHVYEECDDPVGEIFFSNFTVDYQVCLSGYYPWIDKTQYSVCIMKSYKNNFLACFCSMNAGKPHRRSFCITKFECLFGGKGVEEQRGLELSDTCFKKMHYFIEINHHSANWVRIAQVSDKLRVRAPYHPDSPCYQKQFEADFDIGQIDVNNLEAGILSLTTLTEEGLSKFTKTVSTCPTGANLGLNEHLMENIVDKLNQNMQRNYDQCSDEEKLRCFRENDDMISKRNEIEKIIEKRSSKLQTHQVMKESLKSLKDTYCSAEVKNDETPPKITLPAGVTINDANEKPELTEKEQNESGQGKVNYSFEDGGDTENECDKSKQDNNNNCHLNWHKKNIRRTSLSKISLDFYTLISGVPFMFMQMYSTEAIGRSTRLHYFREYSRLLPIVTGTYWFIRYWSGLPCRSPEDHFNIQDLIILMCLSLVGCFYYNFDEYAIFAMKVCGFCLIVDLPIHHMTQFISYQTDISLFSYVILPINWAIFGFYVFQNIWKITKIISQSNIENEKRRFKKRLGRSIQREDKSNNVKTSKIEKLKEKCNKITKESSIPEVSMASILCQSKFCIFKNCNNLQNLGTVSINCTARCFLEYHQQCWKMEMDSLNIKNERSVLQMDCSTSDCWGNIKEIINYDPHGAELPRKICMTANEILKFKQKHPKSRKGQDEMKCKPNKGKSERNRRKESETDDQEQRKQIMENANGKKNSASKFQFNKTPSDSYIVEHGNVISNENVPSENFKKGTIEKHENPRILKKSVSVSPVDEIPMDIKITKRKQKIKKTMSLDEFRADVDNTGIEIKSSSAEHQSTLMPPIFTNTKQLHVQVCISSLSLSASPPRYSTPPPSLPTQISENNIISHHKYPSKPPTPVLPKYSTPPPPIQKNIAYVLPSSRLSIVSSPPTTICSVIDKAGGQLPKPTSSMSCLKKNIESLTLQPLDSPPARNLFLKHPLPKTLLPLTSAAQQITLSPFISPLQLNIPSTTFEKEIHTSPSLEISPPASSLSTSSPSFLRDLESSSLFSQNIPSLSGLLLSQSDSNNSIWQSKDTQRSSDNSSTIIDEREEELGNSFQFGNVRDQNKRENCSLMTSTVEFVHDCQLPPPSKERQNLVEEKNVTYTFIYCHGKDSISQENSENDDSQDELPEISSTSENRQRDNNEQDNKNMSISPESLPSLSVGDKNASPLTKIVAKKFPHVSIYDIKVCLANVLSSFDAANTTLPEFINLISEQVENYSWKDEIYMSDEDEPSEEDDDIEDLDECAICTELLEIDLETMDPCGHVFHTLCIRSWAKKEATCPQCRANIQLSP